MIKLCRREKRKLERRIDIHMLVRRHRLFSAEAGGEFLRIAETRWDAFPFRVTFDSEIRDLISEPPKPTMEQEVVALGHDVHVVDPDVRGYVYSLVTAVCILLIVSRGTYRRDYL
jgi:hypothetical protein